MGQHKRTPLVESIFPLLFHTEMTFEKVFWTAADPGEVMDSLEGNVSFCNFQNASQI